MAALMADSTTLGDILCIIRTRFHGKTGISDAVEAVKIRIQRCVLLKVTARDITALQTQAALQVSKTKPRATKRKPHFRYRDAVK